MKCQRKNSDEGFILFHGGRIAIGFVRLYLNTKSRTIRIQENVITFKPVDYQ
jgi:hypothetical protein